MFARHRPLAMSALTQGVFAFTRVVNRASVVMVGILALGLTVVVLLQVLYRYVLELPLVWSDEAARHLLVWLSFTGGGVAIAQRLHPRIELIDSLRVPRARKVVEISILLLVLAFLVVLFFISADVARTYNTYRSLGLGLPQSIPRSAIPVGACLMAINVFARLLEQLIGNKSSESTLAA
jgi:TRAP-type C4-dicarboxylate transport system permease small subunit